MFALPQRHGRIIVGLTDEDAPGPVPSVARPTEAEIAFLLASLNRVITAPIGRDRVRGAFAGLRPLIDSGSTATADISRKHLVTASESGVIAVLGGKLTTYRRMAEDAVDLAVRTRLCGRAPASRTAGLRLVDGPPVSIGAGIADGIDVTQDDVAFAVRAEGALTADDVIDRRTRIGLVDADRERCLPIIEKLVAEKLVD